MTVLAELDLDATGQEAEAQIRRVLAELGPLSCRHLAQATQSPVSTTHARLVRLESMRDVHQVERCGRTWLWDLRPSRSTP